MPEICNACCAVVLGNPNKLTELEATMLVPVQRMEYSLEATLWGKGNPDFYNCQRTITRVIIGLIAPGSEAILTSAIQQDI